MVAFVRCGWIAVLAGAACALAARAEDDPGRRIGLVEAGGSHAELTRGYGSWDDQYVRGEVQVGDADRVRAEAAHQSHFGDEGTLYALEDTRTFDERWYGSVAVGASDRGAFLPRLRVDAVARRKWLARKNVVTGAGMSWVRSRGPYTDVAAILGATYYFDAPWILEVGARLSRSDPGAMRSGRGWIALMHGHDRRHWISVKLDAGNEAWQVVAADAVQVDFPSLEATFVWRQWLTSRFGLVLRATSYRSRYYVRSSADVGAFLEF